MEKKHLVNKYLIGLQILSVICFVFLSVIAYCVEFRFTFNGFGNPVNELPLQYALIIRGMVFVPFCITIGVYIANLIYMYKMRVGFVYYVLLTFLTLLLALLLLGMVQLLIWYFPNTWKIIISQIVRMLK